MRFWINSAACTGDKHDADCGKCKKACLGTEGLTIKGYECAVGVVSGLEWSAPNDVGNEVRVLDDGRVAFEAQAVAEAIHDGGDRFHLWQKNGDEN